MEGNSKTFWELTTDYKINIPIIQRDYAQGRKEEFEKRNKFLNSLYETLTSNKVLDLDFVYGRINNNVFYPIDGQQRLTTLFLLHWYLSLKENIDKATTQCLSKFVYDTRISSREFCRCLISENIDLPTEIGDDKFIDLITDKHWFRNSWKSDPTITAMLVMIQAIHDKFYHVIDVSIWDNIVTKKLITFQVLDLGAKGFELTDELYIKMNARGKQLTPFENFKANFIQFIDKNFKDSTRKHPVKGDISYSGYFSYKIEKEWTDLFWAYRGDKATIDIEIANYFEFIAQMCFFKSNRNAKAEDFRNTFNQYEIIFQQEENLLFLFDSLDKLYEIYSEHKVDDRDNLKQFFDSFIKTQSSVGVNDKVTLSWIPNNSNLFERIIKNSEKEDARTKILFYSIVYYLLKHDIASKNGLANYVRVLRNLIQATRQRNETKYNTNIRINIFGSYWLLFEQLATVDVYHTLQHGSIDGKGAQISDNSLRNEKEKAEIVLTNPLISNAIFSLEEFKYLDGLIHILKPMLCQNKLPEYCKALSEIWNDSIPDSLKIQAFIACGFEGLKIKDTRMGPTYYFGKKLNWTTILTNEEIEVSSCIILLLDSYLIQKGDSTDAKLQAIVSDWLRTNLPDRSWKYYFLSYSSFTSKSNYYVWPDDHEIRILGTEGSNPLVAYHISPFVFTVCRLINDKNVCDEADCYLQYSGHSPLLLKNGMILEYKHDGWLISDKCGKLRNSVISKYQMSPDDNDKYLLRETTTMDKIQIATDFIKTLLSS